MQDVQLLVMPQGFIVQCPDLNRSKSISPALHVGMKSGTLTSFCLECQFEIGVHTCWLSVQI